MQEASCIHTPARAVPASWKAALSGEAGKRPVCSGGSAVEEERASVQAGLDTGSLAVKRFEHMILCAGKPVDEYGWRRKKGRALSPEHCQMEAGDGWAPSLPEPQRGTDWELAGLGGWGREVLERVGLIGNLFMKLLSQSASPPPQSTEQL